MTRDPQEVNDLFAFLINVLLIATSLQKHLHGIGDDDRSNINGGIVCDRASQRPHAIGCGLFALAIVKHLSALLFEFAQYNQPRCR